MKPATTVLLNVVRGLGIAWFTFCVAVAAVIAITAGTVRGEASIVFTIGAYSLLGAVAAVASTLLLRRTKLSDDRRGFPVDSSADVHPRSDRQP